MAIAFFGYLAGFLAFLFYLGIIVSIVKRTSSPSLTTWIIWSINDLLILCSSLFVGVRNTIWVPLVYSVCGFVCLGLSIKHDSKPFSVLDKCCLVLSLLAWVLWGVTNNALLALSLGVVVNTLGAIPTWAKVYREPKSETLLPWVCVWLSSMMQILAIESWTLGIMLFPLDSVVVSGTTLALTLRQLSYFRRKPKVP